MVSPHVITLIALVVVILQKMLSAVCTIGQYREELVFNAVSLANFYCLPWELPINIFFFQKLAQHFDEYDTLA